MHRDGCSTVDVIDGWRDPARDHEGMWCVVEDAVYIDMYQTIRRREKKKKKKKKCIKYNELYVLSIQVNIYMQYDNKIYVWIVCK